MASAHQCRAIWRGLSLLQSGNIRSYATWVLARLRAGVLIVMGLAGGVR